MDLSFDKSMSSERVSPLDDGEFSNTALKYINQMLMDEDMEAKPSMFYDPSALIATEKSLYEVLGKKYPPSWNEHEHPLCRDQNCQSSDDSFRTSVSDCSEDISSSSSSSTGNSIHSFGTSVDSRAHQPSVLQNPPPAKFVFQSTSNSSSQSSANFPYNMGTSMGELQNLLSENELMLQFKRGLEEGNKFLPKDNQLVFHVENNYMSPYTNEKVSSELIEVEKDKREHLHFGLTEMKNHDREETDLVDGRSNKQMAVCTDETGLSELFDKVLLFREVPEAPTGTSDEAYQNNEVKSSRQQGGRHHGTSSGKTLKTKIQEIDKEVVDLLALLILCAQAVSANDIRNANELLKKIRRHSTPHGDGSQRLAHLFAKALEARLAGTGKEIFATLDSINISAVDMLRTYQTYISASPFKKISIIFANQMIFKAAEKATKLHIIDFGILYGFQWPVFIQSLSRRPGGPPKLRITGIEFPQHGFRPEEMVKETGCRLAKYCERFGVPFEYHAIAEQWQNIQIEDLKIDKDEVLAVNCLHRFKSLLDETVSVKSPRNAVLHLIRKIKPDIFAHAVFNGTYNVPFFVTRFREALFHFASLFDGADTILAREDPLRLAFEKDFIGREIMNVIACEGLERVERPETYKQWQLRNTRAGFRQLPLDMELVKRMKAIVKHGYHRDFVVEEDSNWMLQGWKGRILCASSCWVPV
ncbi:scarecrow-like protein 14 [Humulus lupulus]|uniref:scarecrow-like protein 14 n=1 Tax=Humulus lupulus TaxID=3486 RepID=UPI002B4098F2|nr:scarecrow-like protein 14 [Humulus lupulus]